MENKYDHDGFNRKATFSGARLIRVPRDAQKPIFYIGYIYRTREG